MSAVLMCSLTPTGQDVVRREKSTSGGAIVVGKARVKTWSKTQGTIAQSSAESELLASVKGAAEAIGIISLARDIGI